MTARSSRLTTPTTRFALLAMIAVVIGGAQQVDARPDPRSAKTTVQEANPRAAERVYLGVFLHDITSFAQQEGTFNVDSEVWMKWRGTFDPSTVRITNEANVERVLIGQESDGDWHSSRWRMRGTLRGQFPLHRFPFDQHELPISFELPTEGTELIPDLASSGVAKDFSLTDWEYEHEFRPHVADHTYGSDLGMLAFEGRAVKVKRAVFNVFMKRPLLPVLLKLFLPLAIILLVGFASLFLHPALAPPRTSMAVTAFLSSFAFQFTVADALPDVAYLTFADVLFLIGYGASTVVIALAVLSCGLFRSGRERMALRLDRAGQVLLPIVTALTVWIWLPAELPVRHDLPEPEAQAHREPSAKSSLTLGTGLLPSLSGSPLATAAGWGIVHDDPILGKIPAYVERIPGVNNDALRLLPAGKLEVTWTLREGSHWSDGKPLTADDLTLTLEAIPNEAIEKFEITDPRTLVITWRHRVAEALEAPTVRPRHALEAVFKEGGYDAIREHEKTTPLPSLGPYRIVDYQHGRSVKAEANPHFRGPPPSIAEVTLLYFESSEQAIAAFLAGEVDFLIQNTISLAEANELIAQGKQGVVLKGSLVLSALTPDLAHPALAKLPVRRALLMAIDRERLANPECGGGLATETSDPEFGLPTAHTISHDPDQARKILERELTLPLTLPLYYRPSSTIDQLVRCLSTDLGKAGVVIEPTAVDSPLSLFKKGGYEGLLLYATRAGRDRDPRGDWNIPTRGGQYPDEVRHGAYTDEVHSLIERYQAALYPDRQEQIRDEILLETGKKLPRLNLAFSIGRVLAHPDLAGWQIDDRYRDGTGLEYWHFKPPAASP